MKNNHKLTIEIGNLTLAQKIAIEDLFATWLFLGKIGASRWTNFFVDGDGNFHPKIKVNREKPKTTDLIGREKVWTTWENGQPGHTYQIDYDKIAWELHHEKKESK